MAREVSAIKKAETADVAELKAKVTSGEKGKKMFIKISIS